MVVEKEEQRLFIIISQTGTLLSNILRLITGAKYNHVSIGLYDDLDKMYSFGRLNPYNPFHGGFVIESPHSGTFKRFKNTDVIVLSLDVGYEKHGEIFDFVEDMCSHRKKYHYNYFGLIFASLHIVVRRRNRYYCSEFVRDILRKFNIEGSYEMNSIVLPIDFLNLPFANIIYEGKLRDYSAEIHC